MEEQVHRIVCSAVEDICGSSSGPKWTPAAKLALTKLILNQIDTLALDLEAFSKYHRHNMFYCFIDGRHGKRATITVDDVKLALRKNPTLLSALNAQLLTKDT